MVDIKVYCGSRTERCDGCQQYIAIRLMDVHQGGGCGGLSVAAALGDQQQSTGGSALLSPGPVGGEPDRLYGCPYCGRDHGDFDALQAHVAGPCPQQSGGGGGAGRPRVRRTAADWEREMTEALSRQQSRPRGAGIAPAGGGGAGDGAGGGTGGALGDLESDSDDDDWAPGGGGGGRGGGGGAGFYDDLTGDSQDSDDDGHRGAVRRRRGEQQWTAGTEEQEQLQAALARSRFGQPGGSGGGVGGGLGVRGESIGDVRDPVRDSRYARSNIPARPACSVRTHRWLCAGLAGVARRGRRPRVRRRRRGAASGTAGIGRGGHRRLRGRGAAARAGALAIGRRSQRQQAQVQRCRRIWPAGGCAWRRRWAAKAVGVRGRGPRRRGMGGAVVFIG
jgi:hypothetical protein